MRGVSAESTPYTYEFVSFGIYMQARASSEDVLERMKELLPPVEREYKTGEDIQPFSVVDQGDERYSVYNPTTLITTQVGLELALMTVEGQMRSWVAVNAPDVIFIHAGVVGHDGGAIVIPGESFAGKTTLVAELVRRGARYFSDEYAVIDREGLVHPYVKSLGLRSRDSRTETAVRVEEFGGVSADTALPMTLAAVTHYVPGAEWNARRLSPGESVLALLSRTVPARTRPQEAMEYLTRAIEGAVVLEGERGEAEEFAEMILDGALV
jgi:hypothetical protein